MQVKIYFKVLSVLLAILGSSTMTIASITLSGTIANPNSEVLIIQNEIGDMLHVITLEEDHSFTSTFDLPDGYYELYDEMETTLIYLEDGFNLMLALDTKQFDESVEYIGRGAPENNYLAKKTLLAEKLAPFEHYRHFSNRDEASFIGLVDSIQRAYLSLLTGENVPNDIFYDLEQQKIGLNKTFMLGSYEQVRKFAIGDFYYQVSSSFPNPFENFNINEARLSGSPMFLQSLEMCLASPRQRSEKLQQEDYSYYLLQRAVDTITNLEVRQRFMYIFCYNRLEKSSKINECYELYKANETDEKRLKEIEKKFVAKQATAIGAVSPSFSFTNMNGKEVSSESLKGKAVLIDVWATWCGPCIQEMPALMELKKKFENENITFVGVAVKDDWNTWQRMVTAKKLGGIQLFAKNSNTPFFTSYQIAGIPRFILLDKNGVIVNPDAPRPSSPLLSQEIEALLAR